MKTGFLTFLGYNLPTTVTKMSLNNVPWVSLKIETLYVTVQCGYLYQWAIVSLMFACLEALFQSLLITYIFHLILKQDTHRLLQWV